MTDDIFSALSPESASVKAPAMDTCLSVEDAAPKPPRRNCGVEVVAIP
jgi:hypothetical protein